MKGQDTGVTWAEAPQVASTRRRGGAHDLQPLTPRGITTTHTTRDTESKVTSQC